MLYAAVDLGSNSFHLLIARQNGKDLDTVLHLRETVRLAGGMGADGCIAPEAKARALDCLRRFAGNIESYTVEHVHAVGTNTLRVANDDGAFLRQAESALGHPIKVISGKEEAQLIYLGVVHELQPDSAERMLVLDIGGGSTEIVIGAGEDILLCESVPAGCVGLSERYCPDGDLSRAGLEAAQAEARAMLEPLARRCVDTGWDRVVATSGTAHAIRDVLALEYGRAIPLTGLAALYEQFCRHAHLNELDLNELAADRVQILPGGVAILGVACELLGIERLEVADNALRNGLLYAAHTGLILHRRTRTM